MPHKAEHRRHSPLDRSRSTHRQCRLCLRQQHRRSRIPRRRRCNERRPNQQRTSLDNVQDSQFHKLRRQRTPNRPPIRARTLGRLATSPAGAVVQARIRARRMVHRDPRDIPALRTNGPIKSHTPSLAQRKRRHFHPPGNLVQSAYVRLRHAALPHGTHPAAH